jgi:hypothetical protein
MLGSYSSAPEKAEDPHQQAEGETKKDACDDGKIKTPVATLVDDIPRQAPQPERELRCEKQEEPDYNQNNADD